MATYKQQWSPFKSPTKRNDGPIHVNKVSFFRHFPKDFLRIYGAATDEGCTEEAFILTCLRQANCEWLCRPSLAASELCESIQENKNTATDLEDLKNAESEFDNLKQYLDQLSQRQYYLKLYNLPQCRFSPPCTFTFCSNFCNRL